LQISADWTGAGVCNFRRPTWVAGGPAVGEGALEVHETRERIEHAEHAHRQERKRAALIIILLAVALALTEMAGKEAQFASIEHNIEASDLYAFYQAKTIRSAILRTAVESTEVLAGYPGEPEARASARRDQLATWKSEIDRMASEPGTREGRKELLERAKVLEGHRDREIQSYHHFELASAALQLAIVIASAAVITEVTLLEFISVALGFGGCALAVIGWLAPGLLRL
jgi:hypothetical protein